MAGCRWIVDDGPLDALAMVVATTDLSLWPRGRYFVADATARNASGRRKEILHHAGSPFSTFSVEMGTKAADVLYRHLRQPSTSDKNLAEHQSIAWALTESSSSVLVAYDKRAAFLALAELGRGAAAHASELWLHLLDEGLVDTDQFSRLCARTSKSEQCPVPLRCQKKVPAS